MKYNRKRTHTQQKYQKYQKWTLLFFFGQTNEQTKKREIWAAKKQHTTKTRRHIFSNKTHINNGRRIENEENKNEKAEPTK